MNNRRHRRGRHAAPPRRNRVHLALASATCLVAAGTLATGSQAAAGPAFTFAPPTAALDPAAGALDRAASDEVSRDLARRDPASAPPSAPGTPPGATPSSGLHAIPVPVAGLDRAQTANAATIVAVGRRRGLPRRAMVVAVATSIQETDLHNMASTQVPESLRYPHQGVGADHDSVGLFQQRPSQGWGTVAELMDPAHSAGLFYDRLERVSGWESMSVTGAAQAVQRSAFPDAYQRRATMAERVVDALG